MEFENDGIPRFLSWGCGLQSTVIGEMSARGDLPHCTVIHADTGWERQITYQMRDWYATRWREMGLEVHIIGGQNIKHDGAEAHIHMPFWTDGGGPLRRQCTRHFKLKPLKRKIRECLGYHPTDPPAPKPGSAIVWLGITVDEWTRAEPSRVKFMVNQWPLLALKMDRQDCADWLEARNLPIPPKSACIGCPYRRASEWIEMREQAPDEWRQAVEFDEENRHNPFAERDGSEADALYIYRNDTIPLADANLEADAARERRYYGTQLPMFACESGFCGV